ncbi:hypothetical protein SteCoe_34688 [Stentor coeruleus]|uniref:Uncharacterized protein n=1 Tax=Stentor coeruleus TaxID=5963 RepID=A0A1R2ATZ3_9CILI|nr:hypothetical protein SteCoe_34688 [Stentor coeruleus]
MDTLELFKRMFVFDNKELNELEEILQEDYKSETNENPDLVQSQVYEELNAYIIYEKNFDIKQIIKYFFENYNQKLTEYSLLIKFTCLDKIYLNTINQNLEDTLIMLHKETRKSILELTLIVFSLDYDYFSKFACVMIMKLWVETNSLIKDCMEYTELIHSLNDSQSTLINLDSSITSSSYGLNLLNVSIDRIYRGFYIRNLNVHEILEYIKKNHPDKINQYKFINNRLKTNHFEFPYRVAELIDAVMPRYIDFPNFIRPEFNLKMQEIFQLYSSELGIRSSQYFKTRNHEFPYFEDSLCLILSTFLLKFQNSTNINETKGSIALSLYFAKNNKSSDFFNFCQIIRNLSQLKDPDQFIATELLAFVNAINKFDCMSNFCNPLYKIKSEKLSPVQAEKLAAIALKEPYKTTLCKFVDPKKISKLDKIVKKAIKNVRLVELPCNITGMTLSNCIICVNKHPDFLGIFEGALLFIILHELAHYLQRYALKNFSETTKNKSIELIKNLQAEKNLIINNPLPISQSKLSSASLSEGGMHLESLLFDENYKTIYKSGAEFLLLNNDLNALQLRDGFNEANIRFNEANIKGEEAKEDNIIIRFVYNSQDDCFKVGICGSIWITDPRILRLMDNL